MTAYYNENEPYCAQWLRNLIKAGLIAPGDVDERDIRNVQPRDLGGYTQAHFFAGIGGWSYALRLAGWEDSRPVWTGSCPCQPFSVAGKRAGFADRRHLWPEFRRLIAERRPPVCFGEQTARAPDWLGLVRGDFIDLDYAMAAIPMEAASAHADHFRDRYWFVAERDDAERRADAPRWNVDRRQDAGWQEGPGDASECCQAGSNQPMADRNGSELREQSGRGRGTNGAGTTFDGRAAAADSDRALSDCDRDRERHEIEIGEPSHAGPEQPSTARNHLRPMEHPASLGWGEGWTEHEFRSRGFTAAVASIDDCQYVECPDGKWRRLPPPRVRWLGTRIPARIPQVRALGNAIDTRPAAEFIKAYLDARP